MITVVSDVARKNTETRVTMMTTAVEKRNKDLVLTHQIKKKTSKYEFLKKIIK